MNTTDTISGLGGGATSSNTTGGAQGLAPAGGLPAAALLAFPGAGDQVEQPLTPEESGKLQYCEERIQAGLETFIEVGRHLSAIREGKLYRHAFETFEDYVLERWGMSVRRAYQVCDGAEIARDLGLSQGVTESQLRELVGLGVEDRRRVWERAGALAGKNRRTARLIRVARGDLGLNSPSPRPSPQGEGERAAAGLPGEAVPVPLPARAVVDVGQVKDKANELRQAADRAVADIRRLMELAGTADSVRAVGLRIAIQQVQDYREHLARVEELHAARPQGLREKERPTSSQRRP